LFSIIIIVINRRRFSFALVTVNRHFFVVSFVNKFPLSWNFGGESGNFGFVLYSVEGKLEEGRKG